MRPEARFCFQLLLSSLSISISDCCHLLWNSKKPWRRDPARRQVKAQATRSPRWAPGLAGHLRHQRPGRGAAVTAPAAGRGPGKVKLRGGTGASAPLRSASSWAEAHLRKHTFPILLPEVYFDARGGPASGPPPATTPPRPRGEPGLACSDTWWTSPAMPASISRAEPCVG